MHIPYIHFLFCMSYTFCHALPMRPAKHVPYVQPCAPYTSCHALSIQARKQDFFVGGEVRFQQRWNFYRPEKLTTKKKGPHRWFTLSGTFFHRKKLTTKKKTLLNIFYTYFYQLLLSLWTT